MNQDDEVVLNVLLAEGIDAPTALAASLPNAAARLPNAEAKPPEAKAAGAWVALLVLAGFVAWLLLG